LRLKDGDAWRKFQDTCRERSKFSNWILRAGHLGADIVSEAKKVGRSPEDTLLIRFSEILKNPLYAECKDNVIVGFVHTLCSKALGVSDPIKEKVIDCLLLLKKIDPKCGRVLREACDRVLPAPSTLKRSEKRFRNTKVGSLEGLLSKEINSMKGFMTAEHVGFSISLDEIYLCRALGILQQKDKKVIIGLEDSAVVYGPDAVANMEYRYSKLARSALLALTVPQDTNEICEPFHVRIGGAKAQGEKEIGMRCTDAAEEYANEKGIVFYGAWVDAVGKCALFVWSGLIAAYNEEKNT
jgi:hypothetical protein